MRSDTHRKKKNKKKTSNVSSLFYAPFFSPASILLVDRANPPLCPHHLCLYVSKSWRSNPLTRTEECQRAHFFFYLISVLPFSLFVFWLISFDFYFVLSCRFFFSCLSVIRLMLSIRSAGARFLGDKSVGSHDGHNSIKKITRQHRCDS